MLMKLTHGLQMNIKIKIKSMIKEKFTVLSWAIPDLKFPLLQQQQLDQQLVSTEKLKRHEVKKVFFSFFFSLQIF